MKKKFKILGAVISLLCSVFISLAPAGLSYAQSSINDGVYESKVEGHNGPMVVETSIEDGKISSVNIIDHSETEGVATPAIEKIPAEIVEKNSLNIETVSGATVTSDAIRNAVSDAISQAGGEMADFFPEEDTNSTSDEVIEYDVDVVVVGSGISGLSTAISAHDNGAEVLVLEKLGIVGGSTLLSGGEILATQSHIQEELGIESNWQDMSDYFYEISGQEGDKDFYDYIAQNSGQAIQWLEDNGVDFTDDVDKLHSSHDMAWGHYPKDRKGASFVGPLEDSLKDRGIELLTQTQAHTLLQEDGKVVGLEASKESGETVIVHADKVVLATGGFNQNPQMLEEHHPYLDVCTINGGAGNTGDGVEMAEAIGAKTLYHDKGIDLASNYPTFYGYGEEFKGLLVSEEGKRYMDESQFHFVRSKIMRDMDETVTYAITDQTSELVEESVELGQAYVADSLEDLAQQIIDGQADGEKDFDKDEFIKSVERYNQLAQAGEDEDYSKSSEFLKPIEGDKYYALKLVTSNSGTYGGLVVTLDGQVLDTNDQPIEGLFAVGEVANGQYMVDGYPGSGTAIISFLTLGLRVGDYISQ